MLSTVIDDSESEAEDDRGDRLINLFEGLRKDIEDQRAETVRLNRALVLEQEERKDALKEEREKREEALKVEREKREKALKAEKEKREEALKAEREKREEALKVEREKWEKALKAEKEERERERAERRSEKAEADKKYELLKDHLLEVEETTIDTVGWIADNVGHHWQLFSAWLLHEN